MEGGENNHGDDDIILPPITKNIRTEDKETEGEQTLDATRLLQLPKQDEDDQVFHLAWK